MSELLTAVKETFQRMPENIDPDAARGVEMVIQYELSGEAACTYHMKVAAGTCAVHEGSTPTPSLTVKMDAADFLELSRGELDPMSAFMSGKLQVSDVGQAMKMQGLFKVG